MNEDTKTNYNVDDDNDKKISTQQWDELKVLIE